MALITKVAAGGITTLSDARYFAGMAVDWLGFDVDPQSPDFLSPPKYQEMAGWVTGPKKWISVGNLGDMDISDCIDTFRPDAIEVPFNRLQSISLPPTLPIFVRFQTKNEVFNASTLPGNVVAAMVPEAWLGMATEIKRINPLLEIWGIATPVSNVEELLSTHNIDGIFIKGSTEIKPGIKEYSFADLLERLEAND